MSDQGPTFSDDRPPPRQPKVQPPEVQAPLAPFNGEPPPAPAWFGRALANEPERTFVESDGAKIEVLTWGQVGKPGLLLVHGGTAHADWWSFIAPFFAEDYRVAAFSLAGMGGSDWRDTYHHHAYALDAEVVARAAGLYEGGRKPIYIGHSFGGAITFYAASAMPQNMHAAILVDTGFRTPPGLAQKAEIAASQMRAIPTLDRPSRIYPSVAAALARFRLMPPQAPGNLYTADLIARRSLKQVPSPDGSGQGWTWRFDPELWDKLDRSAVDGMQVGTTAPGVPAIHIRGEISRVMTYAKSSQLEVLPTIVVPDSDHHVMIDQPLALVSALQTALALWPS